MCAAFERLAAELQFEVWIRDGAETRTERMRKLQPSGSAAYPGSPSSVCVSA